ncbi:MAG: cytochrome c [Betaproteobacteria bacterium]|nr:cytochrome c [Betaproteobacteria bacterium]
MKLLPVVAATLVALVSGAAFAGDGAKLFAEKTCSACHGKDGKKTLMPDYPKIAGQNVKYIEKQMLDIKSGARSNGNSAAMKGVMVIVSDEEIKDIAEFVSKMK